LTASADRLVSGVEDVELLLEGGRRVTLPTFPVSKDAKSGEVYFDPVAALNVYYARAAADAGLESARDGSLLSLLVAPLGHISAPFVLRKYSLNKGLFYQWKYSEAQGLGTAFPHDSFSAARKGPVPDHLDEDLSRLEKAGFVTVKRPVPGKDGRQPWLIELTHHGSEAAKRFFEATEPWFRMSTIEAKGLVTTLTPETLMARVHSEYPEYRLRYTEVDDS
jgi:hypothetical protein